MLSHHKSEIRRKLEVPWCEFYTEEILAAKFIQKGCLKTELIHYTT